MSRYWNERNKVMTEWERKWLVRMFFLFDGNISKVAKAGEIDRTTVYRIMDRTGLTTSKLFEMMSPGEGE